MIPGVHPPGGVVDGWIGWGWVWVCRGVPCMHTCTCTHAHTCMLNMLNMDASMSAAICNFYTCMNVHMCVCVCVCVCVHACVWVWGHPPCPPSTCPLPRAAGSPKHQNSISPELIGIIRFCTSEHSSTHIHYT